MFVSGWFYFTLYLSYSPLIACNGQLKGYSFSSVFIFIFFESTFDWDLRANIRNIWGKKLSLVSNYISTLYKKSRDCCAQLLVSALFVTMRLFSYPLFMDSMAPCLQWIGSLTWTPWLYGCNDGSVRFVRMPWLCGYNDGFACLWTPWLLGDNRLVSLVWTPRLCGRDGRLMSYIFFFVMVIFPIIVSTLLIEF